MPPTTYHLRNESGIEVFTGTISPAPGGGSHPGTPVVRGFSFAYDLAGLEDGVEFYTPDEDEILLDAWFQTDTAWNGTTPLADFGTFYEGQSNGFFGQCNGPIDLTQAFIDYQGTKVTGSNTNPISLLLASFIYNDGTFFPCLTFPYAVFEGDDPLSLVVSQSGGKGGDPTGADQGAATLFLKTVKAPTVTPVVVA